MLSINMRIFKTILLLVAYLGTGIHCLPIADETTGSKIDASTTTEVQIPSREDTTAAAIVVASPTTMRTDTTADYYDQRQNGTENYRIHVDGVVLVFAPVEALLLAGAAGQQNLSDHIGSLAQSISEPLSKPSNGIGNTTDLAIPKTMTRPGVRLANFLAPLIRRIRHEGGTSVH